MKKMLAEVVKEDGSPYKEQWFFSCLCDMMKPLPYSTDGKLEYIQESVNINTTVIARLIETLFRAGDIDEDDINYIMKHSLYRIKSVKMEDPLKQAKTVVGA